LAQQEQQKQLLLLSGQAARHGGGGGGGGGGSSTASFETDELLRRTKKEEEEAWLAIRLSTGQHVSLANYYQQYQQEQEQEQQHSLLMPSALPAHNTAVSRTGTAPGLAQFPFNITMLTGTQGSLGSSLTAAATAGVTQQLGLLQAQAAAASAAHQQFGFGSSTHSNPLRLSMSQETDASLFLQHHQQQHQQNFLAMQRQQQQQKIYETAGMISIISAAAIPPTESQGRTTSTRAVAAAIPSTATANMWHNTKSNSASWNVDQATKMKPAPESNLKPAAKFRRPQRPSAPAKEMPEEILLDSSGPIPSALPPSVQGTTPHYSQRMIIPLTTDEDQNWLSELQCFIRSEILEIFRASKEDVKVRNKSKTLKAEQVGIRCRFCAHLPPNERASRSSAFPSSIPQLYQSFTMVRIFLYGFL